MFYFRPVVSALGFSAEEVLMSANCKGEDFCSSSAVVGPHHSTH